MASKREILHLTDSGSFRLVAISTQLTTSKLLWALNSTLNFQLARNTELEQVSGFPSFSFRNADPAVVVSLMQNRYEGQMLVKQLGNIDYVLEFTGALPPDTFTHYVQRLKKIPNIMAVIEVSPTSVRRNEPFCPE